MNDYIAFETSAWAWIFACFLLMMSLIALGAVGAYAIGLRRLIRRQNDYEGRVATVDEVDVIAAKLHERLTRVERAKGIPVLWARDDEATKTAQSPAIP